MTPCGQMTMKRWERRCERAKGGKKEARRGMRRRRMMFQGRRKGGIWCKAWGKQGKDSSKQLVKCSRASVGLEADQEMSLMMMMIIEVGTEIETEKERVWAVEQPLLPLPPSQLDLIHLLLLLLLHQVQLELLEATLEV